MFDIAEQSAFNCGSFTIYNSEDDYIEITNHDKLITKRMNLRKKLTQLTNKQLLEAVMA